MRNFEITEQTKYFNNSVLNFVRVIAAENLQDAENKENKRIQENNNKFKHIQVLDYTIKEI